MKLTDLLESNLDFETMINKLPKDYEALRRFENYDNAGRMKE